MASTVVAAATAIVKRRTSVVALAVTATLIQVGGWWLAEPHLESYAWTALLRRGLEATPDDALVSCVEVEGTLYAQTPERLLTEIEALLAERGVALRQLELPRGADSPCSRISVEADYSTPVLGRATVAYFVSDANGDAVLLFPLFGKWIYLHSWSLWF